MQPSIATDSLWGELSDKLSAIANAGFVKFDLRDTDFATSDLPIDDIATQAKIMGLQLHALIMQVEGHVTDPLIGQALEMLGQLKGELLLVEFATNPTDEDLNLLAQQARNNSSKIAVLSLESSEFESQRELNLMCRVKSLNEKYLGIAIDSSRSLNIGTQPARLRELDGQTIFYLRLSDSDGFGDRRRLPGQGGLNLKGLTRLLLSNGFSGQICVACDPGLLPVDDSDSMASDARLALVNLLDGLNRGRSTAHLELPDLPSRVYPRGIEFVEFAVNADTYEQLVAILSSLCFRLERRHVSKSVELWRQGGINIVVNSDKHSYARQNYKRHGPSVCDICLRVDDADQTVARAKALGAKTHHESVSEGELEIPAILGLDGNLLHFIDQKSNLHHNWDIDFSAVNQTETIQPAGLRRIDHISQVMPLEQMQSWLLRYLATFELKSEPGQTVSDPAGPVRCRSIYSREGELRLSLNGVQSQNTIAGGFLHNHLGNAGVQHIALHTDDVFETSARLSKTGFSRLSIPSNYYTDLQLRFGLDGELIHQLQSGDVLYDRDADGEFFHFYSDSMFGGFFFEIVQRRGRYNGYGARNAPTRLAAQQRNLLAKVNHKNSNKAVELNP